MSICHAYVQASSGAHRSRCRPVTPAHARGTPWREGRALDDVGNGTLLAGRYRLGEQHRETPDDTWWEAVDETLDRVVSVRVLRADHPRADDVVDAARRSALVEDRRLVRVLYAGHDDSVAYVVSEHVTGTDLADLAADRPLPAADVRRIVGEAAQALDHAASRGLHHLRLTPHHLTVREDGDVKVHGVAVDAALAGEEPEDGAAAVRDDAAGLVRLLYAGLTGRWPGPSGNGLEPAPRFAGRTVPPGDLVAGVPRDLDSLCRTALDPGNGGPATVGDIATTLEPWGPPEPVGGQPTSAEGNSRSAGSSTRHQGTGGTSGRPGPSRPAQSTKSGTRRPGTPRSTDRSRAAAPSETVPVGGPAIGHPEGSAPAGPVSRRPQALAPKSPPVSRTDRRSHPRSAGRESPDAARSADSGPAPDAGPVPDPGRPARSGATPDPPGRDPGRTGGDGAQGRPVPPRIDPTPTPTSLPELFSHVLQQAGLQPDDPIDEPVGWRSPPDDPQGARRGPGTGPQPVVGVDVLSIEERDNQTKLVVGVLIGLILVGLLFAIPSIFGLGMSSIKLLGGDGIAPLPTATSTPTPTAPPLPTVSESPTASATASPSGTVPVISGINAIDPEGDGDENGSRAVRAIDHDPGTSWRSEIYQSGAFGGLKKGLGLVVELEEPSTITEVTVQGGGSGGEIELRTAEDPGFEGSTVAATGTFSGGKVSLTPTKPATSQYVVLWFTELPRAGNEFRAEISEIEVR